MHLFWMPLLLLLCGLSLLLRGCRNSSPFSGYRDLIALCCLTLAALIDLKHQLRVCSHLPLEVNQQ
jgi:hypothetical protein